MKNSGIMLFLLAFAPIENPQVAIAIIVENAGSGSSKAAPLARALLDEYF